MTQKLVSLSFSNDQLATIEATLAQLETQLGGLISLTIDQRKSATKLGAKSEKFCRETIRMLEQNPGLVPPATSLGNAPADLINLDHMRAIARRLGRLTERANDTEFGMASDAMVSALSGYALLKAVGNNQGLVSLRKSIGGRFAKSPRQPVESPPQTEAVKAEDKAA